MPINEIKYVINRLMLLYLHKIWSWVQPFIFIFSSQVIKKRRHKHFFLLNRMGFSLFPFLSLSLSCSPSVAVSVFFCLPNHISRILYIAHLLPHIVIITVSAFHFIWIYFNLTISTLFILLHSHMLSSNILSLIFQPSFHITS